MIYGTASALLDAVRRETDWSGATDTQSLELLNRGFLRIQREHSFWWQERATALTLAPASAGAYCVYAQPTDCKQIRALDWVPTPATRQPLHFVRDFPAALLMYPDPDKTADPQAWSLYEGNLYIFPKFTATAAPFSLYYYRFFPQFALTGSNLFLEYAPDALLHATKAEYYEVTGENSKAQYERQLVADAVQSVLKQHQGVDQEPSAALIQRPIGTVTKKLRGPWGRRG